MLALLILVLVLGGFMFAVNTAGAIVDFEDGNYGRASIHTINALVYVFVIIVASLILNGGAS